MENVHKLLDMVNDRSEKVLFIMSVDRKCVVHAVNKKTYAKTVVYDGTGVGCAIFLSGVLWGLGKG